MLANSYGKDGIMSDGGTSSAYMHLGYELVHLSRGKCPHGRRVDIAFHPQMQEQGASRLVVRGFKD